LPGRPNQRLASDLTGTNARNDLGDRERPLSLTANGNVKHLCWWRWRCHGRGRTGTRQLIGHRKTHAHAHALPHTATCRVASGKHHRLGGLELLVLPKIANQVHLGSRVERFFNLGREGNIHDAQRRDLQSVFGVHRLAHFFAQGISHVVVVRREIERGDLGLGQQIGKALSNRRTNQLSDFLGVKRSVGANKLSQNRFRIERLQRVDTKGTQTDGAEVRIPQHDWVRRPPLEIRDLLRADEVDFGLERTVKAELPTLQGAEQRKVCGVERVLPWLEHIGDLALVDEDGQLTGPHDQLGAVFDLVVVARKTPGKRVLAVIYPFNDVDEFGPYLVEKTHGRIVMRCPARCKANLAAMRCIVLTPGRTPVYRLPSPDPMDLRALTPAELQTRMRALGVPTYRAEQVFRWLHGPGNGGMGAVKDPQAPANVPAELRAALLAENPTTALTLGQVQVSSDGTKKMGFQTHDNRTIEAVLIPDDDEERDRLTLCVSSQVGCALDCAFCATATLGFGRHLTAGEIVQQIYWAIEIAGRRPTNLVFMGMGEPMHNLENVTRAFTNLLHPWGAGFSPRRITVSTAGVVTGIDKLAALDPRPNLAISLNATTDEVRNEVMPINKKWNIQTLLDATRRFPLAHGRKLTFEYVLLADVNDSDADARRLGELLSDLPAMVNVIPWNPFAGPKFRRPSDTRIRSFQELVRATGLPCYVRTPRGDDIDAACGQLAAREQAPIALSGRRGESTS